MTLTNVLGWIAVTLATLTASCMAFWGVNEAFHEGWCKPALGMRLLQVCAYLAPAITVCALSLIAIRWPRIGASLLVLVGAVVAALIVYDGATFGWLLTALLTAAPALVGLLFLVGRPEPKRAAYLVATGIPLAIVVGFGAEPAVRIANRFDDGNRGSRVIAGNGVTLQWAPAGPGWTREGLVTWDEAMRRVQYLTSGGRALTDKPTGIWRLPTREELVRSMTRGGKNAGGTWDAKTEQASYARRPDKESPLWDSLAPLIYLWTADQAPGDRAWIVVYHGGVFAKPKATGSPSNGFRAVRTVPIER